MKLTITELKKMPPHKRLTVYAGGEIRTVTAGWLLKKKQEAAKHKRKHKCKGR